MAPLKDLRIARPPKYNLGGVDTNELSSKTMEAKAVSGLYFIGEVVDVTGHLGGYNFQWAWSSGFVAGCTLDIILKILWVKPQCALSRLSQKRAWRGRKYRFVIKEVSRHLY